MIWPLAWLVRVEDTLPRQQWLVTVADRLLQNLDALGAIRAELGGAGAGRYGAPRSNADYGKHEAPIIAKKGDEVADMLYNPDFALNEAAAVPTEKIPGCRE